MRNSFNINDAFATAAITLLGGIALFIIKEILDKVLIKPIQKQKEIIEEIAVYLIHYSKLYTNPVMSLTDSYGSPRTQYLDAIDKTRELAALLKVRTDNIPFYNFWERLKYVLPKHDVDIAWRELIGLSNSYSGAITGNADRADKIRGLLKIPKAS